MINFLRGDISGVAQFELLGRKADELMVLLGIPLVRTRIDAGIIVTIQPRALTDECGDDILEGGGDDSDRPCLDLFCGAAE